jgi:hypothetical protein
VRVCVCVCVYVCIRLRSACTDPLKFANTVLTSVDRTQDRAAVAEVVSYFSDCFTNFHVRNVQPTWNGIYSRGITKIPPTHYLTVPCSWLRHCATSRKFAGSRPDELKDFFLIYLTLPATLGPVVYTATNRNEYQKKANVSGE